MEDKKTINPIQNLLLESREKLTVSGVSDVLSFDDQIVIIETDLGLLTIKGENLKINKLNIDTSDFILNGKINSLSYSEGGFEGNKGTNILGKIFK
ncbi:MAG: sporulation protein YabP [Clostridia bacterium]|nr:sporulation protein YabP [Clostridia bacterium]